MCIHNVRFIKKNPCEYKSCFPLQYVTREAFATAGGNGSVQLFQHNNNDQLESKATWNRIHTVLGGVYNKHAKSISIL